MTVLGASHSTQTRAFEALDLAFREKLEKCSGCFQLFNPRDELGGLLERLTIKGVVRPVNPGNRCLECLHEAACIVLQTSSPQENAVRLLNTFSSNGDQVCLGELLDRVTFSHEERMVALTMATKEGQANCVELLLERGPLTMEERGRLVVVAAQETHVECLRKLLATGPISRGDQFTAAWGNKDWDIAFALNGAELDPPSRIYCVLL